MKLLLDSGAYSEFMRGSQGVGETVRSAEQVLMLAVVVGELLYAFQAGAEHRPRPRPAALVSWAAVCVVRPCRPDRRGPLLEDHVIAEG